MIIKKIILIFFLLFCLYLIINSKNVLAKEYKICVDIGHPSWLDYRGGLTFKKKNHEEIVTVYKRLGKDISDKTRIEKVQYYIKSLRQYKFVNKNDYFNNPNVNCPRFIRHTEEQILY